MEHNIYQWSAKYYDNSLNSAIISADIQFYVSKLKGDEEVLEIGCGTGRVAIALAGHPMSKLDSEHTDRENNTMIQRHSIGKSWDKDRQVIKSIYRFMVFQDGVKINEIDELLNLGYLYYSQAVKMFEACGFKIQAVSKDWNSTPYSDLESGGEMIFELSVL